MIQILEWSPLIVFFVAFKLLDIYWATAALMLACLVQTFGHRLYTGKFKTMHIVVCSVAIVLGAATLFFHDHRFIQWKPTVLLTVTAVAFLGSQMIGKQPLVRRMLESAFADPLDISRRSWATLNALWAVWFLVLAAVNLYIARNFTESTWVNFKLFGIPAAMLIFTIPQVLWMSGRIKPVAVNHE